MRNQYLSVICNTLKIIKILMSTLYLMFPPLLMKKSDESVAEGGEKSNNDLSHTVHVDIP